MVIMCYRDTLHSLLSLILNYDIYIYIYIVIGKYYIKTSATVDNCIVQLASVFRCSAFVTSIHLADDSITLCVRSVASRFLQEGPSYPRGCLAPGYPIYGGVLHVIIFTFEEAMHLL